MLLLFNNGFASKAIFTMQIGVLKENITGENRVALTPVGAKKLADLGFKVKVEKGLGAASGFADSDYSESGAEVVASAKTVLTKSKLMLRVNKPDIKTVAMLPAGSLHISFLDPFNEKQLVQSLAQAEVSAISLEMIPRTTKAQRMDALSSQANLAGYVSVVLAASHLPKILPMMMTPAGTIAPARVFIIGVGVAGLQAIATAKRLGARVDAFDTRPVVAEQVRSLGAKFVEIELGEVDQTEQGYAKPLTKEQIALQQAGMAKVIAVSDIVITTAKLFARPPPRLVTQAMVKAMSSGSVVVDMAVDASGGNVEGSVAGEVVDVNGVKIIGQSNLPSIVARNASEMLSANMVHLIDEIWDAETSSLQLDQSNEIVQGCLVTHEGAVVNPALR